jgi:hypothetical protein
MARFARWHIWLGWLVGVPVLLWVLSGIVMVARPIEEVRGGTLRLEAKAQPLPGTTGASEIRTFMQRGRAVTLVTGLDGSVARYDAGTGRQLPAVNALEARAAVAAAIRGGKQVRSLRAFGADAPPLDLREPVPTWQVTLADGTHVFVNRDSGEIEAVRTRWWRFYDFMWGLHIMDLQTREDSHNPFVIVFAVLTLLFAMLGAVLLFRRRKSRVTA